MRRAFRAMASAMLITIVLPAAASAAAPIRESATQTGLRCDLDSAAGPVGLFVESDGGGLFASLAIWAPGTDPETDTPVILTAGAFGSFADPTLDATLDLVEATDPNDPEAPPIGEPAGVASLDAELLPSGPATLLDSRAFRDGNRRIRLEQTLQSRSVTGTLTIDLLDGTSDVLDLGSEACGAGSFDQSVFVTNPNAWVAAFDQIFLECSWDVELGSVGLLAIGDGTGYALSQVVVVSGDRVSIGINVAEFSESAFAAAIDLTELGTGRASGSAAAAAAVAPSGERITEHEWVDPNRFVVVGERLTTDGDLSVTLDGASLQLPIDGAHCDADSVTIRVQEKIGHSRGGE